MIRFGHVRSARLSENAAIEDVVVSRLSRSGACIYEGGLGDYDHPYLKISPKQSTSVQNYNSKFEK